MSYSLRLSFVLTVRFTRLNGGCLLRQGLVSALGVVQRGHDPEPIPPCLAQGAQTLKPVFGDLVLQRSHLCAPFIGHGRRGLLAQHVNKVRLKLAHRLHAGVFGLPRSHLPKGGERNPGPVCEGSNLSGFKAPEIALKLCDAGD
jgi:hypothetical protein